MVGDKWLDSLEDAFYYNRIGRGRTYANTGRVYDIKISDDNIKAKVKGNYRSAYNVSVKFKQFSENEIKIILRTINENQDILSALLNHQLPKELYDILKKEGVNVFPTSSDDLYPSCNCPDWADICKHVAGLVYMISRDRQGSFFNF